MVERGREARERGKRKKIKNTEPSRGRRLDQNPCGAAAAQGLKEKKEL